MSEEELYRNGWWIQISPLAKTNPNEFIVGVYKKGKVSWITEICKSGFGNPFTAKEWAIKFVKSKLFS